MAASGQEVGVRDEDPADETVLQFTPREGPKTLVGAEPGARLVELTGRRVGGTHELGDESVIGRDPDCGICLSDYDVSRRHARIFRRSDGRYLLEDLKSRNGTLVNGVRVETRELATSDRIQVGSFCTLLFAPSDSIHDQFLEAQKLETLGRLAGGIAHDFNNMLSAILAGISVLKDDARLDPGERVTILDDVEMAARRAADLTQRLTTFARREPITSSVVDVSGQLKEVCELLRRTFDPSIRLELDLAPGLAVVGDASQLQQVWMNLLVNGRDAMPKGGVLRVVAQRVASGLTDGAPTPHIGHGPYVRVTIRDTGIGMNEDTRRRMFEPFFTTKGSRSGTGLGLAIVYGAVRTHSGHVDVSSEPGRGAEFRVLLPAAAPARPSSVFENPRGYSGRTAAPPGDVLVVDDEDLVRRSSARLLRRSGFNVVEAASGPEALQAVRDATEGFQVVVLDIAMPGMDGIQTIRELKKLQPNIRVLSVSGSGSGVRGREALAAGAAGFLQKPFNPNELVAALWQVITP